jgi:hypothetical protein
MLSRKGQLDEGRAAPKRTSAGRRCLQPGKARHERGRCSSDFVIPITLTRVQLAPDDPGNRELAEEAACCPSDHPIRTTRETRHKGGQIIALLGCAWSGVCYPGRRNTSARTVMGKSRHFLKTVYQQRATMSRDHMPSPPTFPPAGSARHRRTPRLVSRRLVVIDSA